MKARENPFRSERLLTTRYRPQADGWESMQARLASLNHRAAIVGPKGTGKTTLLEDLAPRLAERGLRPLLVRVPDPRAARAMGEVRQRVEELIPAGLGPGDALLLDSAENLSWLAWRSALSRTRDAGGLIITAHRPGRLPTLVETRTSPALLEELVSQLLASAPGQEANLDATALFHRHGGNLREALRELYLQWAQR